MSHYDDGSLEAELAHDRDYRRDDPDFYREAREERQRLLADMRRDIETEEAPSWDRKP